MQRHQSAKKAARQSVKRNRINRSLQSRVKTSLRLVLEAKDKKNGIAALQQAFSLLDRAVKFGLIHPNNAANKKSRLSKAVQRLIK